MWSFSQVLFIADSRSEFEATLVWMYSQNSRICQLFTVWEPSPTWIYVQGHCCSLTDHCDIPMALCIVVHACILSPWMPEGQ